MSQLLAATVVLCGLLATPYLSRVQGQSEIPNGRQFSTQPAAPPIGVTSLSRNPLQIALLHWYNANLTTTFGVGNGPTLMAFDGANMWIVNHGSDSVTRLRASDGSILGTFSVGSQPWGVAYDGSNIWVANEGSNNVTKLRARDGANMGTFTVGNAPVGVAFDGANIWVVN